MGIHKVVEKNGVRTVERQATPEELHKRQEPRELSPEEEIEAALQAEDDADDGPPVIPEGDHSNPGVAAGINCLGCDFVAGSEAALRKHMEDVHGFVASTQEPDEPGDSDEKPDPVKEESGEGEDPVAEEEPEEDGPEPEGEPEPGPEEDTLDVEDTETADEDDEPEDLDDEPDEPDELDEPEVDEDFGFGDL